MKHVEPSKDEIETLKKELLKAVDAELTTPELRVWCSEMTLLRYLRARKFKLDDAVAMLKATIAWRKEKRPEHLRWEDIQIESETGKMYVTFDFTDKKGRPVVVMRPRNQNTADHDGQVNFFIYCMERASYLTDRFGAEKMCWLLDIPGYSTKNAPPWKTSYELLRVLQDHYPERLGEAICYHPPMLWSMFWTMIKPFMDQNTVAKVCMISESESEKLMSERFDMTQLEELLGGQNPRSYDHKVWGKAMLDLEERMWADVIREAGEGSKVVLPEGRSGQPAKDPEASVHVEKLIEKMGALQVAAVPAS